MESKLFIAPYDFTPVGDAAILYAAKLAKKSNAHLGLLNIVKSASEKMPTQEKLQKVADDVMAKVAGVKVEAIVEAGSIFTEIGKVANAKKASLIIMGTHGAKGMQKVFGSFAIKVITSTHIPFVIVQDKTKIESANKIIMPINTNSESLQVSKVAVRLAFDTKPEIVLVVPKEKTPDLSQKLIIFSEVVKKQLAKADMTASIHYLDKPGNVANQVIEYGKKIEADMIAITYFSDALLPQFDTFAQTIITNEPAIPVLIINGKEVGNYYY